MHKLSFHPFGVAPSIPAARRRGDQVDPNAQEMHTLSTSTALETQPFAIEESSGTVDSCRHVSDVVLNEGNNINCVTYLNTFRLHHKP